MCIKPCSLSREVERGLEENPDLPEANTDVFTYVFRDVVLRAVCDSPHAIFFFLI